MLKVGVIGAGAMGQNHIRAYSQLPGVELAGIADVDKKRVEELSRQYNTQGFTDYKEMLKTGMDAVSIVVPTTLHKSVALDVIAAGTNLLVEKPIANNIESADQIIDAAKKQDLKLMVGHIERFNPAVMKMKELIMSGELGKIVSISTRRVGPYNPRIRDVGVILDIGVHDIDIISYLYDSYVSEVYTIAGKEIHSFEDHASMILRFDGDKAGVVETNWLTPHKTRNFTVIGTEGVGYGDYMEQKVVIHDKEWIKEAKVEKKEPLMNELQNFTDACKGKCDLLATGEDGRHALEVAMASVESYRCRNVVKLLGSYTPNLREKHDIKVVV
ncbi:oxidoreductase [Methanocella sp. CWC-04]|uniref:Oxidoreductase n=1 Tax=Methanooceanicella nereidis TaxID=2052831 RepID=A0AAP2W4Z3_9EURY|nr:UDP-N-acetylglucosamine 3-dehydrogenase [Methanocella sp. CWC-04]MCD1294915.1 oxidoreductase [Methanocella sp. CWC-04]